MADNRWTVNLGFQTFQIWAMATGYVGIDLLRNPDDLRPPSLGRPHRRRCPSACGCADRGRVRNRRARFAIRAPGADRRRSARGAPGVAVRLAGTGAVLADHHREALARSGIDPERAASRGYETIGDKGRLAEIKVTAAGRNTPGMLVPLLDVRGSVWGYQYRPDTPRSPQWRAGSQVRDTDRTTQRPRYSPRCRRPARRPAIPLFITEGSKKADCAVAQGLCCVALMGVWNWRGTNNLDGKVALADWHDVALNGRRAILAYDGDVVRKESVHAAMDALGKYLAIKGARVEFLHLPDEDEKVGLDDYLVAHRSMSCGSWSSRSRRGRILATTDKLSRQKRPRRSAASTGPRCSTTSEPGLSGSSASSIQVTMTSWRCGALTRTSPASSTRLRGF